MLATDRRGDVEEEPPSTGLHSPEQRAIPAIGSEARTEQQKTSRLMTHSLLARNGDYAGEYTTLSGGGKYSAARQTAVAACHSRPGRLPNRMQPGSS